MRKLFVAIGIVSIVGFFNPTFALAQSNAFVSVAALHTQIGQLMQQAMQIRNSIKQMAFAQPVQATSFVNDVAGVSFASNMSGKQKQVALQVGHWKVEEAPWELRGLDPHRQSSGGGYMEWEVGLRIAEKTKKLLEKQGIAVTILSAILPSTYKADVFVSIHADQNPNAPWMSGFKIASSVFDQSGKARRLSQLMAQEYRIATGLDQERYIPSSMPYYYAFNHEKFIYAVHPKTPAVIIETGYLPNPRDRAVIVTNPHMPAAGIAQGILKFFAE
jgi:hypothetical protein